MIKKLLKFCTDEVLKQDGVTGEEPVSILGQVSELEVRVIDLEFCGFLS